MLPSFPPKLSPNVLDWDRSDVSNWLQVNNFKLEIINKFYDETIDGATLLLLTVPDLNTLLDGCGIPIDSKLRLQALVESIQLQSNPQFTVPSPPVPLHPPTSSIHSLPPNHVHSNVTPPIQTAPHSPIHHVSMFDKFDSPPSHYPMEDDYRYRNASSSNSTFDAISHIPSENSGPTPQISANAPCNTVPALETMDRIWSIQPPMSQSHAPKQCAPLEPTPHPTVTDAPMKHNSDCNADIDTKPKHKWKRKKRFKRVIVDDSDSSDEDDTNTQPPTCHIKKENEKKRKRSGLCDGDICVERPFKRMKVELHSNTNVLDDEERDADDEEDACAMTLQQKESGKYAIRSTNHSMQHLRTQQTILKQQILTQNQTKPRHSHHRIKPIKREQKLLCTKNRKKAKANEFKYKTSGVVDKRADIEHNYNTNEIHKKEYRYSKENKHDLTNVGKRWTPSELEIIWNLHYEKHWSNVQIAEKFKRTECGVMVQIDKIYKDKRARDDLVNKKYLYQQKVEGIIKGEQKWSEKEHKWKSIKNESDIDADEDAEGSSSSEDDDEPIGARINRMTAVKEETPRIGDALLKGDDSELVMDSTKITKRECTHPSSAFLRNVVSKGTHCWKFKFTDATGTAPLYVGLWNTTHGITGADLRDYIGKYGDRCYVFDAFGATTNIYNLDDEWLPKETYGVQIHNKDIVSMQLDFVDGSLKYYINNIDLGVSHYISPGSYRAAVSVHHKGTGIELMDYIAYENDNAWDEDKPMTQNIANTRTYEQSDCDDDDNARNVNNVSSGAELKYAELLHLL